MPLLTDTGWLRRISFTVEQGLAVELRRALYFRDPSLWAKDFLGVTLWYKQVEIANDVAAGDKKSIAVRAGHGVGKSLLASVLSCWWIDTRPTGRAFVASTAPSADQVTAILWREIRNFHAIAAARHKEYLRRKKRGQDLGEYEYADHPLTGYVTQDNKWRDNTGNLIAQGRKPPDSKEDSFQGIHAEYVLAIGDEACGLRESMIDDLSNITSNAKSRRLLIGNPTNPRTRFGDIFLDPTLRDMEEMVDGEKVKIQKTLQDVWSLHEISVLDSPNFHGGGTCDCHPDAQLGLGMPDDALASLTDQSYVDEKKAEYGEESARFKARVLGQFAYDIGNSLFEEYDIAQAKDCEVFTTEESRVVLGVDVARSKFGDSTFIYSHTEGLVREWMRITDADGITTLVPGEVGKRSGGKLRYVDTYRGVPLVDRFERDGTHVIGQATLVHQHAIELGAVEVRVDKGGMGVGFLDGLWAIAADPKNARSDGSMPYEIVEMMGGGPTPDPHAWFNNRAFQLDHMRQLCRNGSLDIDPADKILVGQLEDILYENVNPHGAMLIESKDDMKKRGVKSPDAADAAWYACADLSFLDGPRNGETTARTPDHILQEMEMAGFRAGFSF